MRILTASSPLLTAPTARPASALNTPSPAPPSPDFLDRFSGALEEQPLAQLGYAVGAGGFAGLALSTVLPTASLMQTGLAGAAGALAGLGFGLVASVASAAYSAWTAPSPEPRPAPQPPVPPVLTPPQVHPDLTQERESEQAAGLLRRRSDLVSGYVDAWQTVKDSLGRAGRETARAAGEQIAQADREWSEFQAKRLPPAPWQQNDARQKAQTRLQDLQQRRASLVATSNRAEQQIQASLGRVGREGLEATRKLTLDLDQEIARLQTALKPA